MNKAFYLIRTDGNTWQCTDPALNFTAVGTSVQDLQFTASSGRHSILERPFSEANGRPFVS